MDFFTEKILKFYLENSRSFFWREKKFNPFQILITELFLQRTRAETVDSKARDFIKRYSSPEHILSDSEKDIYDQVKDLGLGRRRTQALKEIAKYIHKELNGKIPQNKDKLLGIPHVGKYIANAVLCFTYNQKVEIIDSNVERVFGRYFGIEIVDRKKEREELEMLAKKLLPKKKIKDYNWGLLDFAALICTVKPKCNICSLNSRCQYYNNY